MTVIGSTRNSRINKFILAFTIVVCAGGFLFGQIFTPAQASVVKPSTKSVLTARTVARTSSKSKLSNRAAKIPLLQSKPKPKRPQPNYERLRITTPKPDEAIQNGFTVSGYAWRWFDGAIPTKVYDYNNTLLYDGFITAAPVSYSSPTYFSKTITLSKQPTTDAGTIEFNEYSAKNGRVVYQKAVPVRFSSFKPSAVITVLSPNGDIRYQAGQTIAIRWKITGQIPTNWNTNSRGIPDMAIILYRDGRYVQLLDTHEGGYRAYVKLPDFSNDMPTAYTPGAGYQIQVAAVEVGDIISKQHYDFSDAVFNIEAATQPVYKVTTSIPDLVLGKFYAFRVDIYNALPLEEVLVYLQQPDGTMISNGVGVQNIGKDLGYNNQLSERRKTNKDGNWSFTASHWLPKKEQAQTGTYVSWVSIGGVTSNKIYHKVVTFSTYTPWVYVSSPNGGETYHPGDTIQVRWWVSRYYLNRDIKFEVTLWSVDPNKIGRMSYDYKVIDGGFITPTLINQREYAHNFSLKSTLPEGKYVIEAGAFDSDNLLGDTNTSDTSDAAFNILARQ